MGANSSPARWNTVPGHIPTCRPTVGLLVGILAPGRIPTCRPTVGLLVGTVGLE